MPDTSIHNRNDNGRETEEEESSSGRDWFRDPRDSIRARLIKIPVSRGGDFFAVSENFSIIRHQVSLPAADFLRRTM